ncbi:carboxypeptidase-like regulatory domain-containing protein [Methanospirillum lacunae]|uniref:Uncharacterized protein n=2 Tax=Methanospirillum lacunae TaxID=668570 RepID=A0A2V2N5L9_9EURY|nr:hypothetical protein DK846_14360 [Methanospirillum lacunae]
MKSRRTMGLQILIITSIISLIFILLVFSPVYADDISGVVGQYDNWDFENTPTVGMGIFPVVTLEPKEGSSLSIEPAGGIATQKNQVTISPFISTMSGKETNMIVGYMSGARADTTVTIEGKVSNDSDFQDLATITPDENGIFVWPVPTANKDIILFRVTSKTGDNQAISKTIKFTSSNSTEPVVKPVVTQKITPVQTIIPMITRNPSIPIPTILEISASTSMPKVGDKVVISGRLTDMDGNGISGARVTIDETGYQGASTSEPFDTTTTGSDGSFQFTLYVKFVNMVGLVANYAGDAKHQGTESNTLTFTSYA